MFKPTANVLARFSLFFAVTALAACGGGGGGSSDSGTGPGTGSGPGAGATAVKPGIFESTISSGSEGTDQQARTLVSPSGRYAIFTGNLTGTFGTLTLSSRDEDTFSGDGKNLFFDKTWQSFDGSLQGNTSTNSEQFNATFTPDNTESGVVSDIIGFRSNVASDLDVTMTDLNETYFLPDTNPTSVTIGLDGKVTGSEANDGCVFNGDISIPDPAYNIFEGTLSLTNCADTGAVPAEQRNGDYQIVGFLLPLSEGVKNLIFAGTNGNAIFSFSGAN